MKKTMKKWIAFLLCLHTVLFVIFQVSSVVVAETDSFGQYITSGDAQESEEVLEETLESEESTLENEETEETVEETLESEESTEESSEESTEESSEEILESEETEESSEESTEESSEEILESEETEESTEEILESEEIVDASDEAAVIDEGDTEIGDETEAGATLTWMSYEDYRAAEALKAWNNPEMYVGQTAIFNENWGFIFVKSEDEVQVVDDDNTESSSVEFGECCDDNGQSIKVVITDYFKVSDNELWYKIAAADGYTLPNTLIENPYVLYTNMGIVETDPALLMLPLQGMFVGETVSLQKTRQATEMPKEVSVTVFPDFFDVTYEEYQGEAGSQWGGEAWKGYDLSAITPWPAEVAEGYYYVKQELIILIPAEVSKAYNDLMNAEGTGEYNEIYAQLPEEITSQFTEKHIANLEERAEELYIAENVERFTTIMIGTQEISISVKGRIPLDARVEASLVEDQKVLDEGFDVEDASEIVLALDIKIINADGTEFQPKEGERITVSIDMAALGYEDGKIFRLHHKHGDDITVFEVFVVMNGKLTLGTYGFSLFLISDFRNFNQTNPEDSTGAVRVANPGNNEATANRPVEIRLTVGQTVVYYAEPRSATEQDINSNQYKSTWWVTDPEGAIFYEVYSNTSAGSYGVNGQWIRVTALKETKSAISLRYLYTDEIPNSYSNGNPNISNQYYNLTIEAPKADAQADLDGKLYIKDTVNTTGCISATLVDETGKEIVFEDEMSYSWKRDDGAYIIPMAYSEGGKSINICVDHAGLIQDRLTNVTYTVTATLPNGREKTASYTVYYQSEIINANFEAPNVVDGTYTFLVNGWAGLFWKTTSPGTGINLTRDIEYARYDNNGQITGTAFFPSEAGDGRQFAEVNAENFGALYQDIITAPGESVEWQFLHAERGRDRDRESMFIVLGPTEYAQELTNYSQLQGLLREIVDYYKTLKGYTTDNEVFNYLMSETNGVRNSIRYTKTIKEGVTAVYEIWYNDADKLQKPANDAWTDILGEYLVPENQYRTRLFFVTNPLVGNGETNYGNLIDSARGGQYKNFLIEYYEESYLYENNSTFLVRKLVQTKANSTEKTDETGKALVYSSVRLNNYDYFEKEQNDILSMVFINGKNSPYNLKYLNYPCLFIEKYSRVTDETYPKDTISCLDDEVTKPAGYYDQYDIVMQVCFRDTMIAVQKWVEFPKVGTGATAPEALTATEKQKLIDALTKNGGRGYQADFHLDCLSETDPNKKHFADGSVYITKNDPKGWYTGYIPMGDNPNGLHRFKFTEENVSTLTGLEIEKVKIEYYMFHKGVRTLRDTVVYGELNNPDNPIKSTIALENGKLVATVNGVKQDVSLTGIELNKADEKKKIAEVKVTNIYREKDVLYEYVAVGQGTVEVQDNIKTKEEKDTETFKYYSGTPVGVKPYADPNYTFAGWYLDEACTIPVGENHGYVDASGGFIPNKAKTVSDNVLKVTYYAKFSIGSLQIIREKAEPGQVFVYEVKDELGETMYVTLVADASGKGSVEIVNASFGPDKKGRKYTVTQLNDWSWRYKDESNSGNTTKIEQLHQITTGLHGAQNMTTVYRFPIEDKGVEPYWLNGNSSVVTNTHSGGAK